MNNSGPSIEPWGMPHDTYCSVDKTPFYCLTPSGTPSQILHNGSFRLIPKEILVASDPEVLY